MVIAQTKQILCCWAGALVVACALSTGAEAATAKQPPADTGLPLPRFVSLRADEVNVRTGPGARYPVDWVYLRRNLPVKVVAEFESWRKIRDWQGTEGWVHRSLLSGRRTVLVIGQSATLNREASAEAPEIAKIEAGVVGRLLSCAGDWCRIEIAGLRGWMAHDRLWGLTAAESDKER